MNSMTREEAAAYRIGFRAAIEVLKNSWHYEVPCDDEEMAELMQQMEDTLAKEQAK